MDPSATFDDHHYGQRDGHNYTNNELDQEGTNDFNQQNNENLPLEYRDEYKFKNGAIYKGQWRGTVRHGRGV